LHFVLHFPNSSHHQRLYRVLHLTYR
jgi:hypothetical protein